ncbi:MAG: SDR family oxidoreductase [Pseudomonadota bacterium]
MTDWTNTAVLITGASRGIGAAGARHFASLGAAVTLAARSTGETGAIADEISKAGGRAIAVPCDVARYDDVAAAVDATVEAFGRLDVLVNNAGLIDPIAHLSESDPAEWTKVIAVNVNGVYHGMRAAAGPMEKAGSGVIINISSGAATSALEGWSHYCASKAAVLSLTKCGHKELSPKGISVVGLSPGTVATHMQVAIKASGINPVSQLDPAVHISPGWVAQAMAFLATEGGRAYDGDDFKLRTDEARDALGLPRAG